MSSRTIKLDIAKSMTIVRPRQHLNVPIDISGVPGGEGLRLTLAAVDEGILGLTKFQSPDPTKFYFGRKALGVGVRDDYGRLLNANLGAPSIPKQGGDSLGGEGLTVVPTKNRRAVERPREAGQRTARLSSRSIFRISTANCA